MDPVLTQAISTLIGACATALLMFASYYWGPNGKGRKDDDDEDEPPKKRKKKVQADEDEDEDEVAA